MKLHDFEFFEYLGDHSRLSPQSGLLICDLMAKVVINNPVMSGAAAVPLIIIIRRFLET